MTATLIGNHVCQAELHSLVPPPPMGPRHNPIAFKDIDEMVLDRLTKAFPYSDIRNQYVTGRNGMHAFATYEIMDNDNFNQVVGWRNAYDQAFSARIPFGKSVFFCANLLWSAESVLAVHKNTTFAWDELVSRFDHGLSTVLPRANRDMDEFKDRLVQAPVSLDEGYRQLGLAVGHGVLTPSQATPAYRQWTEPPDNPEFQERTGWALYNACTEGLKKGAIANATERYSDVTRLFQEQYV